MASDLTSWKFKSGAAIAEHLTSVSLLGGGNAYEAYLAFDDITYAPVVVKVVRPDQVTKESTLRGLRREAESLAVINHPVVVRGLRHHLEGERPYLVLENIDGPRLSTLIRKYGPLPEQQYLPLAIDLASALHYFGYLEYVHLDIKPSNIIMGSPGRLIDLSVARPFGSAAKLTTQIGTDAYMAPEQCDPGWGANSADGGVVPGPGTDIYGLGATLFEAVAGYRPFDKEDKDATALEERYPQLTQAPYDLPEQVPVEVAKTLYAMIEHRPENRPTAREVAESLEPVLARQPKVNLGAFKVQRG
jgi:eukaryotic-like serine/threonine-protein kinase